MAGTAAKQAPSSAFRRQYAVVKAQLDHTNRWIINPRHSPWVSHWDAVVVSGLLYTAVFTPVDVGLVQERNVVLFTFNTIFDVIFLGDLVLNFFLAYQSEAGDGHRWVTDRKRIARRYLMTWFGVDFVSVLPFELFDFFELLPDGASLFRATRIVRLMRLVKLLRIFRASRILTRWRDFLGMSFAQLSIAMYAVVTFFMVHLMACAWGCVGLNWYPTEGLTVDEIERPWIEAYGYVGISTHRIYLLSMYVSVAAMFGGVSSITPQNFAEYMLLTTMMFLGSMVWAWVIGSLCGVVATLNPHGTAFRNTMDELNHFMRIHSFPRAHKARLREFFRHTKEFSRQHSYDTLFEQMSRQLCGDTALLVGRAALNSVWYFSHSRVERGFVAVVALHLRHHFYEAREQMQPDALTIIAAGLCARRLLVLTRGGVIGIDIVMKPRHWALRDLDGAFCLTFVQTSSIEREALAAIVAEHFPAARAHLTYAAAVLTIRAAFKRAIALWRKEQRKEQRQTERESERASQMDRA